MGYTPYHFVEEEPDNNRRYQLWTEALECKYLKKGQPYSRKEFERLLGRYDAALDLPGSMFWDDLCRAYPDAKVILTTRDLDSWFLSMHKTIFAYLDSMSVRILQYVGPESIRQDIYMNHLIFNFFCDNDRGSGCRQAYLDHNSRVRDSVPGERLLELTPGNGWEPLCGFLGVPIPERPYPKTNSAAELSQKEMGQVSRGIWLTIKKLVGYQTPILVAGAAGTWLYWKFY